MDWAADLILDDFYKLLKELELKAIINITHQTKFIEIFRRDRNIELGIHPNYYFLLTNEDEKFSSQNILKVVNKIKELEPEAVVIRSHALTDSSIIVEHYDNLGIMYDSNKLIPP